MFDTLWIMFEQHVGGGTIEGEAVTDPSRAVTELLEACRGRLHGHAGARSDHELLRVLPQLELLRRAVDAAVLEHVGELDARGVTDRLCGARTPQWLATRCGLGVGDARGRVQMARSVRSTFPDALAALRDGDIGVEHCRVLARSANARNQQALADHGPLLVRAATELSFEAWQRNVVGLAEQLDADGGHDPRADLSRNELQLTRTFDDVTHVSGKLVGSASVTVTEAIEREADALFRQMQSDLQVHPDLEIPSRATIRAMALEALCRKAGAVEPGSCQPPVVEATLVVTATEDGERAVSHRRWTLTEATARGLLGDARWRALRVDAGGTPLDLGRSRRFVSASQRAALVLRDGGCVFPGCTAEANWCDAHHVIPWEAGGLSDLDNLALLCRYHHMVTHRNGWRMGQGLLAQRFEWLTPDGTLIASQRHVSEERMHWSQHPGDAGPLDGTGPVRLE